MNINRLKEGEKNLPYNNNGKRYWLSLWNYAKQYPNDNILYQMPDYRADKNTCKWCGQSLKSKRQQSYCCEDCKIEFQRLAVWGRGVAPLPYRILCRDNFTCKECGLFGAYKNKHGLFVPIAVGLDVHHLIQVSEGGTDQQNNLITICNDCHNQIHGIKSNTKKNLVKSSIYYSEQKS